ncbi:hypothetical protein ACFQS7_15505 [Dankookia sp. GCM10030260]|uniref:hypothetical protein n=1 Tax=Dankookia sp. GCM10030260 TaxID=3273390 RepID=UPI0036154E3A
MQDLHADGTLTLYAAAAVGQDKGGIGLTVRVAADPHAAVAAPAVGAAVGALVTLLGGTLTLVSRSVTSGLVGAVRDLDEAGLDAGFLHRISRRLRASGDVVVAEVEEERQLPLDSRILALGGRISRHRLLRSLSEERTVRELSALSDELRRLRKEQSGTVGAEAGTRVKRDRMHEFQRLVADTQALARNLRSEAAAKVVVLRAQAAQLDGPARQAVEQRAAAVRQDLEARAARVERMAEAAGDSRCNPGRVGCEDSFEEDDS